MTACGTNVPIWLDTVNPSEHFWHVFSHIILILNALLSASARSRQEHDFLSVWRPPPRAPPVSHLGGHGLKFRPRHPFCVVFLMRSLQMPQKCTKLRQTAFLPIHTTSFPFNYRIGRRDTGASDNANKLVTSYDNHTSLQQRRVTVTRGLEVSLRIWQHSLLEGHLRS
jgi:hypothetical protein